MERDLALLAWDARRPWCHEAAVVHLEDKAAAVPFDEAATAVQRDEVRTVLATLSPCEQRILDLRDSLVEAGLVDKADADVVHAAAVACPLRHVGLAEVSVSRRPGVPRNTMRSPSQNRTSMPKASR
jgi:hypothetical protein